MSSGLAEGTQRHQVADFTARLRTRLGALADVGLALMSPDELRSLLPELTRAKAQVTELELRVLAQADALSVGDVNGSTNTPAWWAHATHQTRGEAHRLTHLAKALDTDHEPVRTAMATGRVLVDQAHVIVRAVDALPADLVDPVLRAQAEAHLLELATHHDAKALKIFGRRILDIIAPDIGEEHERRQLEDEERKAAQAARFTITDDGHGSFHGRFRIPALHGEMLRKHLIAIAAPKRNPLAPSGEDGGELLNSGRVELPLRLSKAFMEYIERYPTDEIPRAGGLAATVVVTMDLDALLGGISSATLDTGGVISASQARRLACEAGIIPAVLGGRSQILDLGRKRRFHSEPQRVALTLRDRGCTAEGCDWPPGMCHVHHDLPWSKGGPTNLKLGRLLCPRHHARAHDPAYDLRVTADNKVAFHRRT